MPPIQDLFDFQHDGALWLAQRTVGLLSDDLGLGKTAQAIRACDMIDAKRILVICPASVVANWPREFARFAARSRSEFQLQVHSYDMAVRHQKALKDFAPDTLILDEAHFLKTPEAARTKAVFGHGGICRGAKRIWAISGTPAPNHAAELWVLLFTFGRTKMGYEQFVREYCETTQVHPRRVQIHGTKQGRIGEVRAMLAPVILRRTKADVALELPPITFETVSVEASELTMSEETRLRLQADMARMTAKLGPLERHALALDVPDDGASETMSDRAMIGLIEGLAESVSTLRRVTGMRKAQTAAMLVAQELSDLAYDKIVIFAIHRDVIDALKLQFPDAAVITGDTPTRERQAQIDRFQESAKCKVFIGNILAAGTGITLTAAHQVLFVEQDWVPGNNAQAAMRCHRIGQEMPVTVRFVSLLGSIDERVTRALARKTREITQILSPEFN